MQVILSLANIPVAKFLKKFSLAVILYNGCLFIMFILILFLLFPVNLFAIDSPKVITSIRPLQSIISNLTKDVDNNIGLIIDHNESLHNYHLKPSKIKDLHNSKVIIIIDKNFEIFLTKVLDSLNQKNHSIIEIAKIPGIKLQKTTDAHHHHHEHEEAHKHEDHQHHHHSVYDYHLWLDVEIVKIASTQIAKKLSIMDSKNKDKYEANLKLFFTKLEDLDQKIKGQLDQVKDKNFIVTHIRVCRITNNINIKSNSHDKEES